MSETDIAELPVPKRTRTSCFYLVLFLAVAPLWSSILFAWGFVVYALNTGKIWSFKWPGRVLFAVSVCETFFSVYHFHLSRYVAGPSPYGPGNLLEIQAAYTRLLKAGLANLPEDGGDEESLVAERPGSPAETIVQLERNDPRAVDFRNSLRTWFRKVPWSSIKSGNIEKWLYWAMYNANLPPPHEIPESHQAAVSDALELLQKRLGWKLESGTNPDVEPMRLTIDKVFILWRPLSYYALVSAINRGLKMMYRRKWSVHHRSLDGLEYLIRVPKQWDPITGPRPLVFIHGLGLGLLQYHLLVSHLFRSLTDRPILVLLQPQISQDFFHPRFLKPMSRHEAADRLAKVLHDLGWAHMDSESDTTTDVDSEEEKEVQKVLVGKRRGVTMLSHSNGSYTHAWMLKGYPKMVARSCFADPVTFCSWEGDVCYNFMYRPAMTGMELLMRYFVGSEIGVANLLGRHFDWVSNSLWFEEIPNARDPSKTLFLLGGADAILNSERVKRYLTSHGVRKGLWYDPNGRHGQALIAGGPGHAEIFRWLQEHEHL
ncbi:hypothetical protein BDQ12DRAFT_702584 [Crucibulum laeve]|uniref:Alpha/Beta hydrolase protein n=1 Tax=Crucibulum laeve TaxID=68775 RepID=A0A5C3MQG0_9AGAR|nr:hypothetical protein BDQ12DRAFT_702584 [Crucibulum laeve]